MKSESRKLGIMLSLGFFAAVSAHTEAASEAPSFPVGPMVAYPIATISIGYGNNMLVNRDGGEEGSWYLSASAGAGIQGERRGHLYGIEYEAYLGRFDNSSIDNYLDHRVTAYGGHAFNIRNNIKFGAEYLDWHDARSEEDPREQRRHNTSGFDPDEWHQLQVGGKYIYGAPNAKGRIECDACQTNRRYDNNGQEYRDLDVTDVGATLAYRVSPKTDLLLGGVYSRFDYVNEDAPGSPIERGSRDSEEIRYFVGADWDITPKTSVVAKVGFLDKNYRDSKSIRKDFSEPYWDVVGIWSPRGRTSFDLGFSRRLYENAPFENMALDPADPDEYVDYDYVIGDTLRLSWGEQWGARISSNLSGYVGRDDYVGGGADNRDDDIYGATANLQYIVNDWVAVSLNGYYRKRDSNFNEHDYEDSGIGLSLNLGGALGWGSRAPNVCDLRSGVGSVWTTW